MGYTRYWRHSISETDPRLPSALAQMQAIARARGVVGPNGDGEVQADERHIAFNGRSADDKDCEPFMFPGKSGFDFCKTRGYPYDTAVTACLAVAADVFGDAISVSSDGNAGDWSEGVAFASYVLGREIKLPLRSDGQ